MEIRGAWRNAGDAGWCSRTELNRDHKFRKLVLYPFELREPITEPPRA